MITKRDAIDASEFHQTGAQNSDGTCRRWRRNGTTQTWVRSPERFRVPVKHGLYDYDQITENEAAMVHLPGSPECPEVTNARYR